MMVRIGYRYQHPKGCTFFKIGFTPYINGGISFFGDPDLVFPWGGIALGCTLRK